MVSEAAVLVTGDGVNMTGEQTVAMGSSPTCGEAYIADATHVTSTNAHIREIKHDNNRSAADINQTAMQAITHTHTQTHGIVFHKASALNTIPQVDCCLVTKKWHFA